MRLLKGLVWAAVSLAIIGGGFVLAFAAAFSGAPAIATYMIFIAGLFIAAYIPLSVFSFASRRNLRITLASFATVYLLIAVVYNGNAYYLKSLEVADQKVLLEQYVPFAEGTKAASLGKEASLKLTDSLPKMDGATALYPLYSAFAQATYPKKAYSPDTSKVICTNTPNAYMNLINGNVDVIFVARPSPMQLEAAKAQGVKLILTPIGKEAFVFFVNTGNPVQNLALQQIKRIYSGSIKNWNQVGGINSPIRAFQRPEGSGSQTMLRHVMGSSALVRPEQNDVRSGMGGIVKETANYRNHKTAIGYSFLFYATKMVGDKKIRVLGVDGVHPNHQTIKDSSYPLSAPFYAVTTEKSNPSTTKLIDWILSPEGQYLVTKTGYVALK